MPSRCLWQLRLSQATVVALHKVSMLLSFWKKTHVAFLETLLYGHGFISSRLKQRK